MQFRRPRRLRIISGASLLLLLTTVPLALGLTRPSNAGIGEPPGVVAVYASGLASLGWAGFAAAALAFVLGALLIRSQRQDVHRRFLGESARRRHNLAETSRTFAVILGAAGLIVGSLSGLYAAMMQARPDLATSLSLPFFTAEFALTALLGGGALYAIGRIGRF